MSDAWRDGCQKSLSAVIDRQVGDHPALRGKIGRVDAVATLQLLDVVRNERVQEPDGVPSLDAEPAAAAPVDPAGPFRHDAILIGNAAHTTTRPRS